MSGIFVLLAAFAAIATTVIVPVTYLDVWIATLPYKNELKQFFVQHGLYAVVVSMALDSVSATMRPGNWFFYFVDAVPSFVRFVSVNIVGVVIFLLGWYSLPAIPLAKELLICLIGIVWWDMLFNQRQNVKEFKYWNARRGSWHDLGSMVAQPVTTLGIQAETFAGEVEGVAVYPIRRGYRLSPSYIKVE